MVLGGRYGITHGRAIASVMAACLEHSRPGAVGKLAHVARLLGCDLPGSDDDLADWTIDAIERFIASMDLGRSVVEYGVPEADFAEIACQVRAGFAMRVEADPVPADADGLIRILHRSVERWASYGERAAKSDPCEE